MQLDEIAALISPPPFNKSFLARVEMVWALLPGQQVDVGKATNEKAISTFNQPNHHVTNLSISQFQLSIQHHTTVIWVGLIVFFFIALVKVLYSIYSQRTLLPRSTSGHCQWEESSIYWGRLCPSKS